MPLIDQYLSIPFVKGMDTEGDEKTLEPGTPTAVENGVFTGRSTIRKRHGTRTLPTTIAGATYRYVSGAMGLATRDDGAELVLLSSADGLLSYSPSEGVWYDQGDWVHVRNDLISVPQGPNERWDASTASTGTVRLVTWEDARGGVYGQLVADSDPSRRFSADFPIGSTLGRRATAVNVGNKFIVAFVTGTTLNAAVVDAASPSSPSPSLVQLATGIATANSQSYDIVSAGETSARVVFSFSGYHEVAVVKQNGNLGTAAGSPSWPDPVYDQGAWLGPVIAMAPDRQAFAVAWHVSGAISAQLYQSTTLTKLGEDFVLDKGSAIATNGSVTRLALGFAATTGSDSTYTLHAFAEVNASTEANRHVRYSRGTVNATASGSVASGTLCRHARLASKPFVLDDDVYVWLMEPSTTQATDYLYRSDGRLCAVSHGGLAYASVSGTVPNVDVRGNRAIRAVTKRDKLVVSSSGSQYTGRHVAVQETEYHPAHSWRPVDVDGVLYMPGGMLGMYDGAHVVEHGFTRLVEGVTVTQEGGSNLQAGSYLYAVVPEWHDARGGRHLGGFVMASLTVTGSAAQAVLSIPTITHTLKDGTNAPNIRLAVYRSGLNGTVLQRIDDPAAPIVNNTGSDSVSWTDTVTESNRGLGEVIYTEAEPMRLPTVAPRFVAAAGDRLYLAGLAGYPNDVQVSNLRLGGAVAFAGGEMSVDSAGGPVTALAGLRGNVYAFKRSRVFGAPAEGPENLTADTTPWPLFQPVTSDVGAPEPATIVEAAGTSVKGLVFESLRGVRLLGDGVSVADIGGGVRAYDGLTTVGGLMSETDETLRLYTSEGTTRVYNTRFDQWSTFPGQEAVAATLWDRQPAFVDPDGYVYVEDTGSYLDNTTHYPLTVELGWMNFGGLQGSHRLRELHVLGDFYSHHTLRVEMAYDYRDTWVRVREIPTSSSMEVVPYGGPTGYGSGSYGSGDSVYQFAVPSPIQRCQSFRVRFSDVSGSDTHRSYSLTEMKARVAVDKQKPRLPRRKVR